ncbi:transporter substrate-binding domain-containing protein [Paraburkholderia sp. GAS199]|uniref:transporter substrate-binding domain-containing protein n=1 Tax=Paraburkholderia sp. GAS199 TaxID=3035126 RepID=UPI003D1E7C0C
MASTLAAVLIATGVAAHSGIAHAQSVESIKQKGVLTVGVQADQVPWGFIDSKGEHDGYDVDVAKLMAADMGVKLQIVSVTVPNRIAQLMTGKVDVLAAVMGMYPDRAKVIQFSKPYSVLDLVVYGKKGDVMKAPADLGKLRVGVSRASATDIALTKQLPPGTALERFDGDTAPIQALLSGQVDAIGGTNTYAAVLKRSPEGAKYELKFQLSRQYNGLATRPHQAELNAWLNAFVDRNTANGKLTAINQKWLGVDLPAMPVSLAGIPYTVQ